MECQISAQRFKTAEAVLLQAHRLPATNLKQDSLTKLMTDVTQPFSGLKKTNNEVAIATMCYSGYRTRRRDTFFCAAFRKYPKKRRLDCRFLRSSVLPRVGREGFLPSCRRAASMPRPFGLIPTKPAVLVAANESKTSLLRNIS